MRAALAGLLLASCATVGDIQRVEDTLFALEQRLEAGELPGPAVTQARQEVALVAEERAGLWSRFLDRLASLDTLIAASITLAGGVALNARRNATRRREPKTSPAP